MLSRKYTKNTKKKKKKKKNGERYQNLSKEKKEIIRQAFHSNFF